MRVFWGLMLVLVLGASGFLYGKLTRSEPVRPPLPVVAPETAGQSAPGSLASPEVAQPVEPQPPAAAEPSPATASAPAEPARSPQPDPALNAGELDAVLGTAPESPPTPMGGPDAPPATHESVPPAPAPMEVKPSPVAPGPPTPAPGAAAPARLPPEVPSASSVPPPAESAPAVMEAFGPPAPAPEAAPKSAMFAGYPVVAATRVAQADGSVLLDGRFPVKGKGTKEDPYKVTWDLLTSVSETLAPREGKKKLPERITMLNGAWVEVSGYVAFPLMQKEPDELLVMLNQWDGCCIGVPPTPYDAIEVSLVKAVKGQDRYAVQGTLKGELGISPHLVGEWLVGVYVMDEATLSTKAVGGFPQ